MSSTPSAEEKFVTDLSGESDHNSLHQCIQNHRAEAGFGYNLRRHVQPRRPFDIGGDETDSSGNLLYKNHTMQDDDNTTAAELLQEWGDIPVSPASVDNDHDGDDDYDKELEEDEGDDDDDDDDDDDCVSEGSDCVAEGDGEGGDGGDDGGDEGEESPDGGAE